MQRYVQQLVDDFEARAKTRRDSLKAAAREEAAEAQTYTDELDDEASMADFHAEMEEIEAWVEGPKPGITQPLAYYVEVDTAELPPADALSEAEARALFDALNDLLSTHGHTVEEVGTPDCPAGLYYAEMLRVLAEPTVMLGHGHFGHDCGSHPPDCEYGKYCGCTEYWTYEQYVEGGGDPELPRERFMSEEDSAAQEATMAKFREERAGSGGGAIIGRGTDLEPRLLDLAAIQHTVDAYIEDVGVRYFSELTNTAILAEEVGEVARLAARLYGEQSFKREADAASAKTDWADELSDVLFVLTCLANQTGVNLAEAFEKGMDKRYGRDGERHRSNEKLRDRDPDLPF